MAASDHPSGTEGRSSSPALKRPAAEMGEADEVVPLESQDTVMAMDSKSDDSNTIIDDTATETDSNPGTTSKAQKHNNDQTSRHLRGVSVEMTMGNDSTKASSSSEEAGSGSGSDNVYPTPSSMSTYATSASEESRTQAHGASHAAHDVPSIDEQVGKVMELMVQPTKDKSRGYVVSANWLNRVLSRSSTGVRDKVVDKVAAEGEIGPVDNSDLVLVTDPSTVFKDEAGQPFVPLRPGLQMGEDFEILPEEAWNLIMKWYGLSKDSPAIVRFAHNTNVEGGQENIQYELNPPVFTILKVSASTSSQDKGRSPVKTVASTHTPIQKWLKDIKELAHIEMSTKVRVWRILEGLGSNSGIITPAASRSASPAPGSMVAANAGNNLVLDTNAFVALREGAQRELLEIKDQTANEKYNGRSTLHVAGLGGDSVIVLEEQIGGPAGGEWVSEVSRSSLKPTDAIKAPSGKSKLKSTASSGRSSPAPSAVRGRRRKDGKPRGVTGLSNLGNTCYMNSALQCVRSVEELTLYFLHEEFKKDLNPSNPLSHNGDVAKAYANLLHQLFDKNGMSSFAPRSFKSTIGKYGPSFSGYGQQDSQEFLGFLLDGLHEDLNRIHKKPYIEKPDSTDEMVDDAEALHKFADRCWEIHKARNDSVITDLFAGMYKSTLHCPICDKVSIIFDPFNSLTLQLPIESLWTREVFYFPFQKPPVRVEVEIDKNSNVAGLKEYLAKKLDSDPRRLVMAEVYKSKIYRLFENPLGIAEAQINQNDDIAIFELESVPTSYDPDKARKPVYTSYVFTSSHDEEPVPFDSPKADRILVPIYNRLYKPNASRHSQREFFAAPLFVVIKRQDAYDYQAILKQILGQVARLTTKDILHEDEEQSFGSNEDSDMVVTNDDDIMLSDSNVKDASVEGEDGLVDVSMQDAATESASEDSAAKDNESNIPRVLRRGTFIPPGLLSLFEVKVAKTNSATATGFSTIDEGKDFPLMEKRVLPKQDNRQGKKSMLNPMRVTENSPVSSEDELNVEAVKRSDRYGIHARFQDDDSSMETKTDSPSESDSDMLVLAADSAASKKKKRMAQKAARRKPQRPAMRLPYIRPGEAIVLDWGEGAYDALFGGDARGTDSFRGLATWHAVEKLPDPELAERRQLRNRRRQKGISLDDCLDEFGKEEILSENDAWHCPRCKEFRRASKKFELWKTPDILVMHLKRFSANRGFRDKIDAFVDFPIELDLNGRVMMPEEGESLMYDLIAVDNHYGGLGGGHYTAFAKNFVDGGWYEYNDSHVSRKLEPGSVVTKAAYLLFYRRRSDHPLGGEYLATLAEAAQGGSADSDSNSDSGTRSPSGEGKRLEGSSRNGSSSALTGVAAAHQTGDGGLRGGIRRIDDKDEHELPAYSDGLRRGEQSLQRGGHQRASSGMDVDEDEGYAAYLHPLHQGPLDLANEPAWSFDEIPDAYDDDTPQIMHHHNPLFDDDPTAYIGLRNADNEDDDNSSMKAMRSDDGSQPRSPAIDPLDDGDVMLLGNDEDEDMLERGRLSRGAIIQGDMNCFMEEVPLQGQVGNDDDDELHVMELPAPDDESAFA